MMVLRQLRIDLVELFIRRKRVLIVLFITVLQCMIAQIDLESLLWGLTPGVYRYTFLELFLEAFSGCDPLTKSNSMLFPYGWFALYTSVVFVSFDYTKESLAESGMQQIIRMKKKTLFWIVKCGTMLISSAVIYSCIVLTVLIFCCCAGIPLGYSADSSVLPFLFNGSTVYQVGLFRGLNVEMALGFVLSPLILIMTVQMVNLLLSVIVKPIYSFAIVVGILVLSIMFDGMFCIGRVGMLLRTDRIYPDGFNLKNGWLLCFLLLALCIVLGIAVFRKTDIIHDQENT